MALAPVSPPVIPAHYAEVILYWFRFQDTYLVVVVIVAFLRKEHLDREGWRPLMSVPLNKSTRYLGLFAMWFSEKKTGRIEYLSI